MIRTLALALLLATSAAAQLGVQVRAVTDLNVDADGVMQSLPAGTNLSSGFMLQANSTGNPQAPVFSNATSTGAAAQTGDEFVFLLDEFATGGFNLIGLQGSASYGSHQIEIVFEHPTARAFELVIERCVGRDSPGSGVGSSGSVTLQDGRVFQGTPQGGIFSACLFNPFPEIDVVPITLDQSGFQLVLETSGYSIGSLRGGSPRSASEWRITMRPATGTPCASIAYGVGCGPVLDVSPEPTLGPYSFRATLNDPALPSAAWLVGGGIRTMLPLPPSCDLLNDALVVVPWPINAQGHAELILAATPGQVFSLQLQAATFANGLRLSNGFEFACR